MAHVYGYESEGNINIIMEISYYKGRILKVGEHYFRDSLPNTF